MEGMDDGTKDMATGGGRSNSWLPGQLRTFEVATAGPSVARRSARARARMACEAALHKALGDYDHAPGSWRDREAASRPALQALASGGRVPGAARRRRNAAWHAADAPESGFTGATQADLAKVASGPRLGRPSHPGAEANNKLTETECNGTAWDAKLNPDVKYIVIEVTRTHGDHEQVPSTTHEYQHEGECHDYDTEYGTQFTSLKLPPYVPSVFYDGYGCEWDQYLDYGEYGQYGYTDWDEMADAAASTVVSTELMQLVPETATYEAEPMLEPATAQADRNGDTKQHEATKEMATKLEHMASETAEEMTTKSEQMVSETAIDGEDTKYDATKTEQMVSETETAEEMTTKSEQMVSETAIADEDPKYDTYVEVGLDISTAENSCKLEIPDDMANWKSSYIAYEMGLELHENMGDSEATILQDIIAEEADLIASYATQGTGGHAKQYEEDEMDEDEAGPEISEEEPEISEEDDSENYKDQDGEDEESEMDEDEATDDTAESDDNQLDDIFGLRLEALDVFMAEAPAEYGKGAARRPWGTYAVFFQNLYKHKSTADPGQIGRAREVASRLRTFANGGAVAEARHGAAVVAVELDAWIRHVVESDAAVEEPEDVVMSEAADTEEVVESEDDVESEDVGEYNSYGQNDSYGKHNSYGHHGTHDKHNSYGKHSKGYGKCSYGNHSKGYGKQNDSYGKHTKGYGNSYGKNNSYGKHSKGYDSCGGSSSGRPPEVEARAGGAAQHGAGGTSWRPSLRR